MSPAARSLFAFGIYAVAAGTGLVVVPNVVLALLGFPAPADGWIRVVGTLAAFVGVYHIVAARNELRPYISASVWARIAFAATLAGLVVTSLMPPSLLLFAALDVLGAAWTAVSLRRSAIPVAAA